MFGQKELHEANDAVSGGAQPAGVDVAKAANSGMSIKRYLGDVYLDDDDAILLRLTNMAERLDGLTARIDHNTHARSDADHDYITLEVPEEEDGLLFAPLDGTVVGTTPASVMLAPSQAMLCSPVTGRITAQLSHHNAIGLMTFDGLQMLVTVGSSPESYRGSAFRQLAWQNDSVHRGDPLITWYGSAFDGESLDDIVTLTVLNTDEFGVELTDRVDQGHLRVRTGSPLMRYFPKLG